MTSRECQSSQVSQSVACTLITHAPFRICVGGRKAAPVVLFLHPHQLSTTAVEMPSHSPLYDATAKVLEPLSSYVPLSILRWEANVTPLSSPYTASAFIAFYLVTIFSLRSFLRTIKARRGPQNGETNSQIAKTRSKKNETSVDTPKAREKPVISASYLKYPFLIHNVLLSAGSGWLLALMLEEVLPIWKRNGAFYSICGEGAWTMRLETFYIINYYM